MSESGAGAVVALIGVGVILVFVGLFMVVNGASVTVGSNEVNLESALGWVFLAGGVVSIVLGSLFIFKR